MGTSKGNLQLITDKFSLKKVFHRISEILCLLYEQQQLRHFPFGLLGAFFLIFFGPFPHSPTQMSPL